jgi:hypothetical protein
LAIEIRRDDRVLYDSPLEEAEFEPSVPRLLGSVNALQAQYKIVPLSAYGKPYTYKAPPVNPNPGFSMTDAPQPVILGMDTSAYFNMMAKLMGSAAPPAPEDAPILARMAKGSFGSK